MQATAEISLYPLTENYAEVVTEYILEIRGVPGISMEVNGLSTQLFGEYNLVFDTVRDVTRRLFEKHRAVLLVKIAGAELKKEGLPQSLQSIS